MDVKTPGDVVYILGVTRNELGGSEYYDRFGFIGLNVPHVNPEEVIPLYHALSTAIQEELIASAHGIYRGGLGVHLALVAMAGCLGLTVDLSAVPVEEDLTNDRILYSETQGRFIVTVAPENKEKFEAVLKGCRCAAIGDVTEEPRLKINGVKSKRTVMDTDIRELKHAWKKTFGALR
jgi:phosphoribosylformylglycinamidine synthase